MEVNYLETYHYRKYKNYCSNKCVNIVIEQKNITDKSELRGLYKGYLYGMKLFNSLLNKKQRLRSYEIYNHLKSYNSTSTTLIGEKKAIYDIMNMLVDD